MNNIHHSTAAVLKSILKITVKGVAMGILNIIVNPYTLNQIEWLLSVLIVLIKGIVKIIRLDGIDS